MKPDFIQQAQKLRRRIILPESDDNRVLKAAVFCDENNIAEITLLGDPDIITNRLYELSLSLGNIQIVNPESSDLLQKIIHEFQQINTSKGLSEQEITKRCKESLTFANLLLKKGRVDGCVAGAIYPTRQVIKTALKIIKTEKSRSTLSSFFIMLIPALPTPVLFADCAIKISPNARHLTDIAFQCSKNIRSLLGLEAKIALLSFSTNGSAKHKQVDKIRRATELLQTTHPELNIIGEIQFDAAVSNEILNTKWSSTNFQAPANIFVFPNLESGNICYKMAEQLGGATAIGPIFQGLAKPVNDLSRGATVEAIINTIAVTCLQASSSHDKDD